MSFKKETMIVVLMVIGILLFSFGLTALMVFGVCWAFGLDFSLKIAFGIWVLLFILKGVFSINVKG